MTDEELVAAEIERCQGDPDYPVRGWLTQRIRAVALRQLPVETAAQLLRQEMADALAGGPPRGRPDRVFEWLVMNKGYDVQASAVTVNADGSRSTMNGVRVTVVARMPDDPRGPND